MSAELPKMRQAFSDWWRSLPQDQRYDFDSEGRGYKKPPEVLMWAAWQEATRQAMEQAAKAVREGLMMEPLTAEKIIRALIPQDLDHLAGVGNMVDGKDQSEKRHG